MEQSNLSSQIFRSQAIHLPAREICSMKNDDLIKSHPKKLQYYRNVDSENFQTEQIINNNVHKQRQLNLNLKIRNPLFHDFLYNKKEEQMKSQVKIPLALSYNLIPKEYIYSKSKDISNIEQQQDSIDKLKQNYNLKTQSKDILNSQYFQQNNLRYKDIAQNQLIDHQKLTFSQEQLKKFPLIAQLNLNYQSQQYPMKSLSQSSLLPPIFEQQNQFQPYRNFLSPSKPYSQCITQELAFNQNNASQYNEVLKTSRNNNYFQPQSQNYLNSKQEAMKKQDNTIQSNVFSLQENKQPAITKAPPQQSQTPNLNQSIEKSQTDNQKIPNRTQNQTELLKNNKSASSILLSSKTPQEKSSSYSLRNIVTMKNEYSYKPRINLSQENLDKLKNIYQRAQYKESRFQGMSIKDIIKEKNLLKQQYGSYSTANQDYGSQKKY